MEPGFSYWISTALGDLELTAWGSGLLKRTALSCLGSSHSIFKVLRFCLSFLCIGAERESGTCPFCCFSLQPTGQAQPMLCGWPLPPAWTWFSFSSVSYLSPDTPAAPLQAPWRVISQQTHSVLRLHSPWTTAAPSIKHWFPSAILVSPSGLLSAPLALQLNMCAASVFIMRVFWIVNALSCQKIQKALESI